MCRSISTLEPNLDPELKTWLASPSRRWSELATLGQGLENGRDGHRTRSRASADAAVDARKTSPEVHDAGGRGAVAALTPTWRQRSTSSRSAREVQRRASICRRFPTTTIGSFPQTAEVRKARAAHAKGDARASRLRARSCEDETARAVRWQEEIGLDVLVHGEFERNDMVEYFGEQLYGFAFTSTAGCRATARAA